MLKKILKYTLLFLCLFILWMMANAINIYRYSKEYHETKSDIAIVLGAGTSNGKVSAVYRERINHSINLYNRGIVKAIIFTGGFGKGQSISDSEAAKNYAIQKGIPATDIYIEEKSTITFTNLTNAKKIMKSHNFKSALIVSDPLHMKRSLKMCQKQKIESLPSPTPTSMYKSRKTKIKSLVYEAFFYNLGVIQGYI